MGEGGRSPDISPSSNSPVEPGQAPAPGKPAETYPGYPLRENPVGKTAPQEGPSASTQAPQRPPQGPFREVVGNLSRLIRKAF
jgi:hypothetical protein